MSDILLLKVYVLLSPFLLLLTLTRQSNPAIGWSGANSAGRTASREVPDIRSSREGGLPCPNRQLSHPST